MGVQSAAKKLLQDQRLASWADTEVLGLPNQKWSSKSSHTLSFSKREKENRLVRKLIEPVLLGPSRRVQGANSGLFL
jgi:hypothetical protein